MIEIREIKAEDCWPIRHKVMWPNKDFEYIKLAKDQEGLHIGLYKDQHLISVVSCFIEGRSAQFRKFATLESEQGKGYGSKLLSFILEKLSHFSLDRVFCNARIEKSAFYEKFGMKKTDRLFERGGKSYVIMEKTYID